MPKKPSVATSTDIVSDQRDLTLEDICNACKVSKEQVSAYVAEGIIEPEGSEPLRWQFSEITVINLRRAQRLERDLRLNPPGVALALELMDRIEKLEARLNRYQRGEQKSCNES